MKIKIINKKAWKENWKFISTICGVFIILIFTFSILQANSRESSIQTSATNTLSNKKIGWGIKREDSHKQPDVGSVNKRIIDQYDGICMGNPELPYVYLTFDNGYEAGYTDKILAVLKENEVPAAFFITGHYVNSQPELVKKMIDEGHTIRKSFLRYSDDLKNKIDES